MNHDGVDGGRGGSGSLNITVRMFSDYNEFYSFTSAFLFSITAFVAAIATIRSLID